MEWSFGIADGALCLQADDDLLSTLKRLFHNFPTRNAGDSVLGILCWNGNECRFEAPGSPPATIRVLHRDSRTAATTILLSRLLSLARPEWLLLHGNGLVVPGSGRLAFLLGDSGAGKTTLTGQLTAAPYMWDHVAEDLLMIEPGARRLHPFPRALAHRYRAPLEGGEIGAPAADSLIFGFGGDGLPRKNLTEFPGRRSPEPLPLGDSPLVALLEAGDAPPNESAAPVSKAGAIEIAWLSWAGGDTLDSLRRAGLPVRNLQLHPTVAVATYERPLTTPERALQYAMLDQLGILHLHSEARVPGASAHATRTTSGELRRPAEPHIEALKPSVGIERLLNFLKKPAVSSGEETAGRLFFRMAKTLATARFVRFVPGGTPEDSARCLAEVAGR